MHGLFAQFLALWNRSTEIWLAGGWCMPPIALTAFTLFALGFGVSWRFREKGFLRIPERKWRAWIDDPGSGQGPIGEMIGQAMSGRSVKEIAAVFAEMRKTEVAPFDRDLRLIRVCVSAAPLLGLLGTVTGMLATFQALGSGTGADKTMGLVAEGISEALITTEAGLVVAIPGLFFQYQLARKNDRYKAFLAHLETVCTLSFYKRARLREPRVPA
jgi:biopolymer transport protein ExbB